MKNSKIHSTLEEDSAIRDFLASFLDANSNDPGKTKFLEEKIRSLQEQLLRAKQADAALALANQNGCEDFDVSDFIDDYSRNTYFPFIGTREELASVIKDKKERGNENKLGRFNYK